MLPVISRTGVLVALSLLVLLAVHLIGWRRALIFGLPVLLIGAIGL
jgi:predicted exporter